MERREQSLVCGRHIKSCQDDFGGLRQEGDETRHVMADHFVTCDEQRPNCAKLSSLSDHQFRVHWNHVLVPLEKAE
jgi:hypothetical protein